ncbi:hypothetical protein D0Z03_001641 [Geotrichum reessii]|nr:hypothetical protein D0Z03_001641 [Galactomyces reessii]
MSESDSDSTSTSDEDSESPVDEKEEQSETDFNSSSDEEEETIKFDGNNDSDRGSESEEEDTVTKKDTFKFALDSTPKAQESESESLDEEEEENEEEEDDDDREEETLQQETKTVTTYRLLDLHKDLKDHGSRPESQIIKAWPTDSRNPRGLLNSGVTCYMNSAIQMFFHIPPFAHFMQDVFKNKVKEISKTSVTKDLANLHHKVNDASITRNIYPAAIIKRLDDINPMMSMWQQEDAHEYFMSLLSRVQEDTVPPGKKLRTSIIHDIFGGTYEQKVTCQTCQSVSTTHQDFYDLPVSFSTKEKKQRGHYTLQGAVREFFSPVVIKHERNSGYDCEKCKKMTTGIAVSKIEDPSEYLVVNIKRFNFKEKSSRKIKDPIQYPMELDLAEYSLTPNVPLKYKLIGVTLHEGRTTSSGHYVAFCSQPNSTWALYDDESVRKTSEKAVLKHQEAAYFLVYARLTPVAEVTTVPAKTTKVTKKAEKNVTNGSVLTTASADSTESHSKKRKRSLPELSTGNDSSSSGLPSSSHKKTGEEPPFPRKQNTKHHNKSLLPANLATSSKKSSFSSTLGTHNHSHSSRPHHHNHNHAHSGTSKFKPSMSSPHSSLANLSKKLARKREERKRAKRNGEPSMADKLLAKTKKKSKQAAAAANSNAHTNATDVLNASIKKRKLDSEIDKIFGK